MGTRSITRVIEDGKPIVAMYRQMDGYPTGHGKDLADFLSGMRLTNGISVGADNSRTANGYGCLAAQMVAHFKDGPGGFYLQHVGVKDAGQEYEYDVSGSFGNPPSPPMVSVYEKEYKKPRKLVFSGDVDAFLAFCSK
jgi:hypothetical protein